MIKLNRVFSFLLSVCAYLGLGCGALLIQSGKSQAKLIIGFVFAGGGTNKIVPQTGGTYTVNIVASTDNPLTTNLGVNSGYIGALSQVLNGSSIDGDIATRTIIAGLQGFNSNLGLLSDLNSDGRIDLGLANGTSKATSGWMRPSTGGTSPLLLGAATGVIGTFTVTIPAYVYFGDPYDFMNYLPQLDPTGVGNDWAWSEGNAQSPLLSGSVTGGSNAGSVITGSSVTFTAVPEPATWSLFGVTLGAGFFWRRRR